MSPPRGCLLLLLALPDVPIRPGRSRGVQCVLCVGNTAASTEGYVQLMESAASVGSVNEDSYQP